MFIKTMLGKVVIKVDKKKHAYWKSTQISVKTQQILFSVIKLLSPISQKKVLSSNLTKYRCYTLIN